MIAIVNTTKDWGIGNGNDLLVHIPEDMKFFRNTTRGKVIVMGRRTLESFPGGNPLKDRINIVLSRDPDYKKEGVIVCHSVEEVLDRTAVFPAEDVFVIGGAQIYRQFLAYCEKALVTRTDIVLPADTYFPNLDESANWKCTKTGSEKEHEGISFKFTEYTRIDS